MSWRDDDSADPKILKVYDSDLEKEARTQRCKTPDLDDNDFRAAGAVTHSSHRKLPASGCGFASPFIPQLAPQEP